MDTAKTKPFLVTIPNGMFDSNTYIIGQGSTCVVVDCGIEGEVLHKRVKALGVIPTHLILTHAHLDHICGVPDFVRLSGAKLCLHSAEEAHYHDGELNGFALFGIPAPHPFPQPDVLLEHGQTLVSGEMTLEIIHTPGHSPGCICIRVGDRLFTGDTLFAGGVGRYDLPGGNGRVLFQSIRERLLTLEDAVEVFPGHGPSTTIGMERSGNPYVR